MRFDSIKAALATSGGVPHRDVKRQRDQLVAEISARRYGVRRGPRGRLLPWKHPLDEVEQLNSRMKIAPVC
jgi:hypothetical protein